MKQPLRSINGQSHMNHFCASTIGIAFLASMTASAQQVDWLQSDPVNWTMNPGMPEHTLASAPGHLVAMRSVDVHVPGSLGVFGTVAMERRDPISGASLWNCIIGDSVSMAAATVDENGIAYFAGQFKEDQLEICDGTTLQYVGNAIDENAFLIAWDLEADQLVWVKNLTAEVGGWHKVAALAIDPNGDVWYAMTDFFEGIIARVDANGGTQDVRVITECKTIGSISFDPWGGLYVSGATDNAGFSFAGSTPAVDDPYNMFVLRYTPDGSAGFVVFAEDITFQEPMVVATDDGHAYIAGNVFDATNWGGFPVNGADWGSAAFIAKLDSSGTFQWLVESDPPGGSINGDVEAARNSCIAIDEENNVYFTGTLRGQIDWGNGVVSDGMTIGVRTLTVVAFDPNGVAQWARTSFPGGNVWAQTITALAESDAVHFQAHVTNEFTMGAHTTNTGGSQAAVLGRISGLPTAIHPIDGPAEMFIWPNPISDLMLIHMESNVAADLYNGSGQRIESLWLKAGVNGISMNAHAPGIYLLRLDDGRALRVVKE